MANSPGNNQFAAVNRALISHPSEQILSGDITHWGSGATNMLDADKDDYTQCPIDLLSTFHNAGINLLFYDGHVESENWNSKLATPGYFDPSRMCTIYQGTGQVHYTGTAPGN
jgi:prepilin-type processing-associated H-X9-DG protein